MFPQPTGFTGKHPGQKFVDQWVIDAIFARFGSAQQIEQFSTQPDRQKHGKV